MSDIKRLGERYSFIRRVSKAGNVYLIVVPKTIGKQLYRKPVQVTIETIEGGG